ncbi:MAG TPA: RIP metalloprotease RseP [Cyclobacteriaceae bacterium]|nr:RIP metalloprotease RseP [Cyclobacteriaceae bacterium]
MDWMISLAQLLLSISILVAVHEMGHLLAAKYFGMRVEQFSIGFPPKIWSFKKGETEYAISSIPLGGYVKISGMIDESLDTEAMSKEPQPWEFRSKPAWQRLIVMLGGIIVNVIVGILIFIGLTFAFGDTFILKDAVNNNGGFQVGAIGESIGLKTGDKIIKINGHDYDYFQDLVKPETLLSDGASYTVDRNGQMIEIPLPADFIQKFNRKEGLKNFLWFRFAPIVSELEPGTIAANIGLQKGDVITSINAQPITYHDQVGALVTSSGDSIAFTVLRAGQTLSFKEAFPKNAERKSIGFYPEIPTEFIEKAEKKVEYGFFESIPMGTERAFTTLFTQVRAFGKIFTGVLSPKESLSGPIGIMQAFGETWDWGHFWSITGVLSLVLAFMNLLPIPALDGGHVMFLTYEMISRRKPSDKFLENAQKVGMVFLLTLMVLIFANDIIKLF